MDSANSKEAEALSSGAAWHSLPGSNGANSQPGARHPTYSFSENTEFNNLRNIDLSAGYGTSTGAAPIAGGKGNAADGPVLPPYSKDSLAPPSYNAVGGTALGPQPIFTQPGMQQGQPYAYYNNGGSGVGWVQGGVVDAPSTRLGRISPSPIIALTLGILSVLCCCFLCGIPAIVLGATVMAARPDTSGWNNQNRKRLNVMSAVGLGLGALGVISSILWLLFFFY